MAFWREGRGEGNNPNQIFSTEQAGSLRYGRGFCCRWGAFAVTIGGDRCLPGRMMQDSLESLQQDADAVAAVRQGDTNRYGELVARYERRVFAVAWSRVGDASLAEEATQEAFIRAYQRLALLGDGSKFAGWITSIARNVAINLGIRHRRELNKRDRWALEQPAESSEPAGEDAAPYTPETLRQTLEELPPAHRECLVLFYLENKSGTEAATALGITEAAFRVRLHRARSVLRAQLEETLEGSLRKLGPGKSVVPAVMAAVLVSSSAKAATGGAVGLGIGTKVVSTLGKSVLFSWLVPFISFFATLPSMVAMFFISRQERKNFRDEDGFRSELYRRYFRSFLWGFPLLFLLFALFRHSTFAKWGMTGTKVWSSCLLLFLVYKSGRLLVIARNRYQVGMFFYCVILAAGVSAFALGWLPMQLASLPSMLGAVLFMFVLKHRPMRMDYSLFLRADQGTLKLAEESEAKAAFVRLHEPDLLAFARFLGSRWLAANFRWETAGLALRLPPVRTNFLSNMAAIFLPAIPRGSSRVLLTWEGDVIAQCGAGDAALLETLKGSSTADIAELDVTVGTALTNAWRQFRAGDLRAAEQQLGELSESEVFVVPPSRAKSTRWLRFFMASCVLLMIAGLSLQYWRPPFLEGLKPVSILESDVRAFLREVKPSSADEHRVSPNELFLALFDCFVLPSTNMFTPEAFHVMQEETIGGGPARHDNMPMNPIHFAPMLRRALADGWVDWNTIGLGPDPAAHFQTKRSRSLPKGWEPFAHGDAWSWVIKERTPVRRIRDDGLAQLRLLQDVKCLDLVDRDKLVQQIASVQVLSEKQSEGQPRIHDWKGMHGLFHTPAWPTLQQTYFSVAALEILGGLAKMDKEECIKGILRLHRGKGYFVSPNSGGYNEYKITGNAEDTFCAYETLRILGGLDRVDDLDQWEFRVEKDEQQKGELTWKAVEAWVCQQRFQKIIDEHKANPNAPYRSLREVTEP